MMHKWSWKGGCVYDYGVDVLSVVVVNFASCFKHVTSGCCSWSCNEPSMYKFASVGLRIVLVGLEVALVNLWHCVFDHVVYFVLTAGQ